MSKLDKQGLGTLVDELNKSVNTKINVKINSDDLVSKTEIDNLKDIVQINKTEVDKEIADLKQYGSDVKEGFATVITSKGVTTDSSDTFETMINNIDSIIVRSPIEDDEIGVVQWEDGSYKGFKEVTYAKILTPVADRKTKDYFTSLNQYHTGFYTNNYVLDKNSNLYCGGRSRYAVNSRVSKVDRANNLIWQYQFNDYIRKIILDDTLNVLVLAGDITENSLAVTKLNNNGTLIWTRQILDINLNDITVDKFGDVYAISANLKTGQNFTVFKLSSIDGSIINRKDFGFIDQGYVMEYNTNLNIIVLGTNKGIYLIDINLNIIKSHLGMNASWQDVDFRDSGEIFLSTNSSIGKYDKDLASIWSFGQAGGMMAVNDLEEVYITSAYDIYKVTSLGTFDYTHAFNNVKAVAFFKDNVINVSYGSGNEYRGMAFYQDNFKVTENILLDTKYIQI